MAEVEHSFLPGEFGRGDSPSVESQQEAAHPGAGEGIRRHQKRAQLAEIDRDNYKGQSFGFADTQDINLAGQRTV